MRDWVDRLAIAGKLFAPRLPGSQGEEASTRFDTEAASMPDFKECSAASPVGGLRSLSEVERAVLLRVARSALRSYFEHEDGVLPPVVIAGSFGGAFVSLLRGRALRGCVGIIAATDDLAESVRQAARSSVQDPRFLHDPVTADELAALTVEVSVLSHAERCVDWRTIVPGVHGIIVRSGVRSGCFLPKVAVERGWTAEEMLTNCCMMKAGLPPDAWRNGDTELYVFTADAFSDVPK